MGQAKPTWDVRIIAESREDPPLQQMRDLFPTHLLLSSGGDFGAG